MLVLLERSRRVPEEFSPALWMEHEDWRVRFEAIRLALSLPSQREEAIRRALAENHPRLMALGLAALGKAWPASLIDYVAGIANDETLPEEARVVALRALAHTQHPTALRALLVVVDGGRTILGRPRLAPPTPVSLEALRSLALGFAHDDTAAPYLKLAHASSVEAVRASVTPPDP
jgi:hypothetical protein